MIRDPAIVQIWVAKIRGPKFKFVCINVRRSSKMFLMPPKSVGKEHDDWYSILRDRKRIAIPPEGKVCRLGFAGVIYGLDRKQVLEEALKAARERYAKAELEFRKAEKMLMEVEVTI